MNWSLRNYFLSTKIPHHWYGYGEIRIWLNVPLKDMSMERVRVEEFGESNDEDYGWINLVSLGFLSQNYLWKLSTFFGYKGIYSGVYEECKKSCFNQTRHSGNSTPRLERVVILSRELTAWPNWKFCPVVTLQLPLHASHVCHSGDMPVTRSSHETPLNFTHLEFSSHPLTQYPYIIPT